MQRQFGPGGRGRAARTGPIQAEFSNWREEPSAHYAAYPFDRVSTTDGRGQRVLLPELHRAGSHLGGAGQRRGERGGRGTADDPDLWELNGGSNRPTVEVSRADAVAGEGGGWPFS